jgi:hypothetical protein
MGEIYLSTRWWTIGLLLAMLVSTTPLYSQSNAEQPIPHFTRNGSIAYKPTRESFFVKTGYGTYWVFPTYPSTALDTDRRLGLLLFKQLGLNALTTGSFFPNPGEGWCSNAPDQEACVMTVTRAFRDAYANTSREANMPVLLVADSIARLPKDLEWSSLHPHVPAQALAELSQESWIFAVDLMDEVDRLYGRAPTSPMKSLIGSIRSPGTAPLGWSVVTGLDWLQPVVEHGGQSFNWSDWGTVLLDINRGDRMLPDRARAFFNEATNKIRQVQTMNPDAPVLLQVAGSGPHYQKWMPSSGYVDGRDRLLNPGIQPELVPLQVWSAVALGAAGIRIYQFERPQAWQDRMRVFPGGLFMAQGANVFKNKFIDPVGDTPESHFELLASRLPDITATLQLPTMLAVGTKRGLYLVKQTFNRDGSLFRKYTTVKVGGFTSEVKSLAVTAPHLYVATANGTYRKRFDNEAALTSWGLTGKDIYKVLSLGREVLALTSEGIFAFDSYATSPDWQFRSTLAPTINDLAYFRDLRLLYAATNDGVWVSKDQGQTWRQTLAGRRVNQVQHAYSGLWILWAATDEGVFVAPDDPENPDKPYSAWKRFNDAWPTSQMPYVYTLAHDPRGLLYAATDAGVFATYDGVWQTGPWVNVWSFPASALTFAATEMQTGLSPLGAPELWTTYQTTFQLTTKLNDYLLGTTRPWLDEPFVVSSVLSSQKGKLFIAANCSEQEKMISLPSEARRAGTQVYLQTGNDVKPLTATTSVTLASFSCLIIATPGP